jgi:hypothetical protein
MVWALIVAALVAKPGAGAPAAASHVLAGELARVSLPRGSVSVKLAGPPREVEVRVGEETVISSRGRPLRLVDLRPGERVMIACADDASGVHRAQRIKLGGKR